MQSNKPERIRKFRVEKQNEKIASGTRRYTVEYYSKMYFYIRKAV